MKAKILFVAANGLLFLCVLSMLVMPKLESISFGLMSVDLYNRRLAIDVLPVYESDVSDHSPIYYGSMASALGDIYQLTLVHGLEQTSFAVSEPEVVGFDNEHGLYLVRINAAYEGELEDVAGFIDDLNNGVPVVESFNIAVGASAGLTVELMFMILDYTDGG